MLYSYIAMLNDVVLLLRSQWQYIMEIGKLSRVYYYYYFFVYFYKGVAFSNQRKYYSTFYRTNACDNLSIEWQWLYWWFINSVEKRMLNVTIYRKPKETIEHVSTWLTINELCRIVYQINPIFDWLYKYFFTLNCTLYERCFQRTKCPKFLFPFIKRCKIVLTILERKPLIIYAVLIVISANVAFASNFTHTI